MRAEPIACALSLFALWAAPALAQPVETAGRWSDFWRLPITPIAAHVLPTGKVLLWDENQHQQRLWAPPATGDPATGVLTTPASPDWNVFCAGTTLMADGRLFVAGGHVESHHGPADAGIYNPFLDTWTHVPDLDVGRWYATATTLADGDVLVTAGEVHGAGDVAAIPQVYDPATNTWRALGGAPLDQPTYPWMFVAPDGTAFDAGPAAATRSLNTAGPGAWTTVATTLHGDRSAYPAGPDGPQSAGAAVMVGPGRILLAGGGQVPTHSAETIDLNQPNPSWQAALPMAHARQNHNATILADGSVLVTGGTSGPGWMDTGTPVYASELWDPDTGLWTTMAPESQPRWYHSTAVLLPDGRVLSAGGMDPASGTLGGIRTAQVYSPPYLFKGARPTFTAAPPHQIVYGQTFTVQTPDAAGITKVNFIRLGSATHAFNFDQRNVPLAIASRTSNTLNLRAPASGNMAPPGYYMLFLVNGAGVPSEAQIIRVGPSASAPAAPTLTATAASNSQVNLSWSAVPGATGYELQGRAAGTTGWYPNNSTSDQVTTDAGTRTYQNTGLAAGTTYEYRVRALTGAGPTDYSPLATATTS